MTLPPTSEAATGPAARLTRNSRLYLLLIPFAALFAVHPLIVHGCSCGHDFDFHILSWIEAANQFSHGNLHPHWAYTPAFNAGEPRFVFYPPISWYLGALLGLVLTHLPGVSEAAAWTATPILFTWIALTAAGFAMHRLARAFATPHAALLASVVYLVNPYMLFTAYERTAYGELLAAVWIPLLLLAILRSKVTIPRIAIPLAFLWLTNAPAAVMASYTLAFLAAVRLATATRAAATPGAPCLASETWVSRHKSTLGLALKTLTGTILGLALAAFYILPAAYERRYVQVRLAIVEGLRIDQNFLFERTGTTSDQLEHDVVLHTASILAVIMLIATAIVLAAWFVRRNQPLESGGPGTVSPSLSFATALMLPVTLLAAGIGFLLTPWSRAIWTHAPEAGFLQFPWRLLAVLAAVLGLALAGALNRLRLSSRATALVGIALTVALTLPAYHVYRQGCDSEDKVSGRLALFHSNAGTDATDEYTPVTADNDVLKTGNPPFWLADSPMASPLPSAMPGAVPGHLTIDVPRAEDLILNLRDYPFWRIQLNGATDPTRLHRADGLIVLPIPAGRSTIEIGESDLPDQTAGAGISLVAIALLLFTMRRSRTD